MKLDRNINGTGRGKYGLVKTRALQEYLDSPAGRYHYTRYSTEQRGA